MMNNQPGYNIPPSERDNEGYDNSRNLPGFHYVRTNDTTRNLQINHYWEVIASRKTSILVTFFAFVFLLCFLTTLLTLALNSENSYPKVHYEMIDKDIITEETPFEEFEILNIHPHSEYPHTWDKLEKISRSSRQRIKRDVDQDTIKKCKQNYEKCQRLIEEVLSITHGIDKNVNEIEKIMSTLSKPNQDKKLKYLQFCYECRELENRGPSYEDGFQESPTSTRDVFNGFPMPNSEQPEYIPLPIPSNEYFATTQNSQPSPIKNTNKFPKYGVEYPNKEFHVIKTNNTRVENGITITNILKNTTIIEKPSTEKPVTDGTVQTDNVQHYENNGYQNAGAHQNSGGYQNAAGYQNFAGYQNAASFQNVAGYQNRPNYPMYQNGPSFQSGSTYQSESTYQNGPSSYQTGPSYEKGPIYQNGPYYQPPYIFDNNPIFQVPDMSAMNTMNQGQGNQGPVDSEVQNGLISPPEIKIQMIPGDGTKIIFNVTDTGNQEKFTDVDSGYWNAGKPSEVSIQVSNEDNVATTTSYEEVDGTRMSNNFGYTQQIGGNCQNGNYNFPQIPIGTNPTAESMSVAHDVQMTPTVTWTPYPVCFYGPPPLHLEGGHPSPGSEVHFGSQGQQYEGIQNQMNTAGQVFGPPIQPMQPMPPMPPMPPMQPIPQMQQNSQQMQPIPQVQQNNQQIQQIQSNNQQMQQMQSNSQQMQPIPQVQQNNQQMQQMQSNSQQMQQMQQIQQMHQNSQQMQQTQFQKFGPTGPGQNIFQKQNNQNRMPSTVPYYCTYIPSPTIRFPPRPGVPGSEFQRMPFRNSEANERLGSSNNNNARYNPTNNIVEVWTGNCPPGKVMCKDGISCIPQSSWCDGRVDCGDASDEILCSCKDRVGKDRICDGYFDCPRGEDELGCYGCPPNTFSCNDQSTGIQNGIQNGICIPLELRCDGTNNCSDGKDENDCSILTTSSTGDKDLFAVGHTAGYLHKNWRGQWYPVCSYSTQWAREACMPETGLEVDQSQVPIFLDPPMQEFVQGPFIVEGVNGFPELVPICQSKQLVVQCPPFACGTRIEETFYSQDMYRNNNENDAIPLNTSNPAEEISQRTVKLIKEREINPIVGVVGGRTSKPKAWPFVVALYKDGQFNCGGAIVNENWILTAAHCVDKFVFHYFEVQAGILRRHSFSPMAQTRKVVRVAVHPNFVTKTMRNDIALLLLDQPLNFNRWVRQACIPTFDLNFPQPQTTCVIVGWGAIAEHGPDPDELREVEIPILPHCKHIVDQNEGEICAGYQEGGKDACQGDSGGPLLCRNPNSGTQWYVAGIVSHGEGCARPNEPGAYTRVSKYAPWIQSVIRLPRTGLFHVKPVRNCPGFQCQTGTQQCLPSRKQCDGLVDCLGAEDEINCFNGGLYRSRNIGNQTETPQQIFENENIQQASAANNSEMNQRPINQETTQTAPTENYKYVTYVRPTNRFTCKNLIQIVSMDKRCNGIYDCEDGTDEQNCTCKDNLSRNNPHAICDGHIDCFDSSDEENCRICNENQYQCRRSGTCIDLKLRCDKKLDCQLNEDELDCLVLSNGEHLNLDHNGRPHLNSEGVLTQYHNGTWHPVCYQPSLSTSENDLSRLGSKTCSYLGFRYLDYVRQVSVQSGNIPERKNIMEYEYPPLYRVPNNDGNQICPGVYIRCQPILNNPVNSHLYLSLNPQKSTYQWPWYGAIFSDGQYRCPAVLLEPNWLLTSSQCSKNINPATNYTIGVFGVSSYKPPIHRPAQQVAEIDEIRDVKNSDASLFHLKNPVNRTRYVQPIFNEKRIFPPGPQDSCLAVGVDKKYDSKNMFVQPVMKCPKCQRCYVAKESGYCKISNNTDSRDWSGTVSCLGPGGWYPAGIFQNLDSNCGFNKTETINSIDYMNAHIMETMNQVLTPLKAPPCDGKRCLYGKCIPWNRVCDGLLDCPDGADEIPEMCQEQKQRCEKDKIGCKCSQQEMRCGNGNCIPKEKFCDGKRDCQDGSDEPRICNCAAYLKLTAPHKICDNKRDCLDKTDEASSICRCKDASFHCRKQNGKENCISRDMACDSEQDCPHGEDEIQCKTIQGSLQDRNGTGEVMKNSFGVWHSECFSSPLTFQSDAVTVCQSMGFSTGYLANETAYPQRKPVVPERDEFHIVRINDKTWIPLREDKPLVTLVPPSQTCHRLFVNCV